MNQSTLKTGPFGPSAPELGWVPAPRYVLRRHRVLKLMKARPAGRVLEIGCGAGALLPDLVEMGHECVATEHSAEAYELAKKINANNPKATLYREIDPAWKNSFDYVMAFEVLEHIEDDVAALAQWRSLLRPDGQIILSVPAHQKKWSALDVGAGHFRRYERRTLMDAFTEAGFSVEHLETYGFPLANAVAPLQVMRYQRKLDKGELSGTESTEDKLGNTAHSGVTRSIECKVYPLYASFPGSMAMQWCCGVQSLFKNSEYGNGYLIVGTNQQSS